MKSASLPSSLLHVLIDSALPVGTERPIGADATDRLADDTVVQQGASFVALVIDCAVCIDAEARSFLRRVDVCTEEQKLPTESLLLPFDHVAHCVIVITAAGIFMAIGGDDEHRLVWHVFGASILVDVADMADSSAYGV